MDFLEQRYALFTPNRTDDLRIGAESAIGKRLLFQYLGLVEEGPYSGEQMWGLIDFSVAPLPFAWAPGSDLTFAGEATSAT